MGNWRFAGVVVAVAAVVAGVAHTARADPEVVDARLIVAQLQKGRGVFLTNARVVGGPLVFSQGTVVRAPFTCRRCVVGGILARQVAFRGILDLRSTLVTRAVDAPGAIFQQPVLLSAAVF